MLALVRALCVLSLLSVPCCCREIFYLRTGFSFTAASHVQDVESFVLTTDSGTIQLPAADVVRIEQIAEAYTIAAPAAAPATPALKLPEELLSLAASAQGLPAAFVRSVAKIESGLRQDAVSPKGALGLMQLMPATAAALGVLPDDAQANTLGGARYLRELLIQYHNDAALALAAYNAGPGSVAKYGGVPPYPETRRYIVHVLEEYAKEQTEEKALAAKSDSSNNSIATR
jgi:soluble lytic murein transglycosylase-like protein